MNISIVILSWNGLGFLKECLPSVMRAVGSYSGGCEVLLIDNGSSDGSAGYVRKNFPEVKIKSLAENFSFTKAMNKGIRASIGEVVIALNNDVIVERDFIAPLISHFQQVKDVFAVSAKMFYQDRQGLNFGRAKGDFRCGFFRRLISDSSSAVNSLYGCAGGMALDKDKFLKLGGFDEDYEVYWEDLDLCYRAWRRGWKTIYEPRSVIYHKFHGTNISKYRQSGIERLSGENYTLFVFKNILDKGLLWRHILFTPLLMLLACLKGRPAFAKGVFGAFKRRRVFWNKRKVEERSCRMSDREIIRCASTP